MVYSVSYFYLGELGTLFGGLSPPVAMGLQQGCREIFTALKLCHHVKKFENHCSRPSWSYISTFPGSLLATYCVCLEWPTNLLTILSFRFQAKKNIVIIESLISFPPMWEWYFWKLTITFFCLPSRRNSFLYTQIHLHSLNGNPLVWHFHKSKTSQFTYATR